MARTGCVRVSRVRSCQLLTCLMPDWESILVWEVLGDWALPWQLRFQKAWDRFYQSLHNPSIICSLYGMDSHVRGTRCLFIRPAAGSKD